MKIHRFNMYLLRYNLFLYIFHISYTQKIDFFYIICINYIQILIYYSYFTIILLNMSLLANITNSVFNLFTIPETKNQIDNVLKVSFDDCDMDDDSYHNQNKKLEPDMNDFDDHWTVQLSSNELNIPNDLCSTVRVLSDKNGYPAYKYDTKSGTTHNCLGTFSSVVGRDDCLDPNEPYVPVYVNRFG